MEIAPPATARDIAMTNILLQGMRAAMLPLQLQELYSTTGGIVNGAGYIFGPVEISRAATHPVPSITDINRDMAHIAPLRGKTIFGRNDLFFFAFDAFGVFYMLDNISLRPLRKYEDMYRAITDCLAAGKL
ncbi:MAG: hypothetical protein K2I81_03960 [Alphaproteobacteria bacterium]|nr:hypothetical protein [Alphaproteobacteria bacterium]